MVNKAIFASDKFKQYKNGSQVFLLLLKSI